MDYITTFPLWTGLLAILGLSLASYLLRRAAKNNRDADALADLAVLFEDFTIRVAMNGAATYVFKGTPYEGKVELDYTATTEKSVIEYHFMLNGKSYSGLVNMDNLYGGIYDALVAAAREEKVTHNDENGNLNTYVTVAEGGDEIILPKVYE